MRFLDPRIHAYLDYLYVVTLAAAPSLLSFAGIAATLCYVTAIAVLGLSLFTRYDLGLVKLIPFPVHGTIELIASIAFVACPWLFGFAEVEISRNFFVAAGALLFGVWLITDYRAAERRYAGTKTEAREKVGTP